MTEPRYRWNHVRTGATPKQEILLDHMKHWAVNTPCRDDERFGRDPENLTPQVRKELVLLCRETCPAQPDCLKHALDYPETHGIWGGYAPEERRELRKGRNFR